MGRSRMSDNEEPAAKPRERRMELRRTPAGMLHLLRIAKEDSGFRALLLSRRADVAQTVGIWLTPSEKGILAAVPTRQLETMIDRVPSTPNRRGFLRQSAASAVVVLGGAAMMEELVACCWPVFTGDEDDMPPECSDDGDASDEGCEGCEGCEEPVPDASDMDGEKEDDLDASDMDSEEEDALDASDDGEEEDDPDASDMDSAEEDDLDASDMDSEEE